MTGAASSTSQPVFAAARAPWALRGLFVIALVFALREARPLLAPVVIAVVLTLVLAPAVRALRQLGLPEVLGAAVVVIALLGSTVPMAFSLARPAAQWWDGMPVTVSQLLAQYERLHAALTGPPVPVAVPERRSVVVAAQPPPDAVKERLASEGLVLTGKLLGSGLSFAVSAAATVILLYFLLVSEHWMLSRCVEAIPRRRTRALLLGGVRAAQREIARYVVSLGCINVAAGAITGVALWCIGLPSPMLWAAVTAVLCFIPYIGPMLVMALLLPAGMNTFDDGRGVAPLAAFALIHAVESNIFSPWFVGRRLALNPVSVFLSVLFWGWLWGIAGALIAVPLLIALRSLCTRSRRLRLLGHFLKGGRRDPPSLRLLLGARPRAAAALPVSEP